MTFVFSRVNYYELVDPYYYISATKESSTLMRSFEYASGWSRDFLFVVLAYLVNKLSTSFNGIGVIYSFMVLLCFIAVSRKVAKEQWFLLFLIMLFVNPAFVGGAFNIWRQGIAASLLVLSCLTTSRYRYWLFSVAAFFHSSSIFLFAPLYLLWFVLWRREWVVRYVAFPCLLIFSSYMLLSQLGQSLGFDEVLDAYSSEKENSAEVRLLFAWLNTIVFFVIVYAAEGVRSIGLMLRECLFQLLIYCIVLAALVFVIAAPAAERVLQYYFLIFPVAMFVGFRFVGIVARRMVVLYAAFVYMPFIVYGLTQSRVLDIVLTNFR